MYIHLARLGDKTNPLILDQNSLPHKFANSFLSMYNFQAAPTTLDPEIAAGRAILQKAATDSINSVEGCYDQPHCKH